MESTYNLVERDFLDKTMKNLPIIKKVVYMYADNIADQADLEQEIFLQLWKSFSSFRGLSKYETWMYRVALNTAIMSLKKRSLYRLIRNNLKREGTILNYEEGDDYFEKWNLVRKEINHLSDIEKAIVHLYLEGYSYGEIAEILGYSAKCINVRMFRIKEKLKNRLQIDLREELC